MNTIARSSTNVTGAFRFFKIAQLVFISTEFSKFVIGRQAPDAKAEAVQVQLKAL
jgi:hypothetical protein